MDGLPDVDNSEKPRGRHTYNQGPDPNLIDPNIASLDVSTREARWGFTTEELANAVKVVKVLRDKPSLYVGDPWLMQSGMYQMLSRRPEDRAVHEALKNDRREKMKQRKSKDEIRINKTELKKQRDAVLSQLLLESEREAVLTIGDGSTEEVDISVKPITDRIGESGENEDSSLELYHSRVCYTCKTPFKILHHFYYSLCPPCADLNYTKRTQTRDMRGHVVLLTGCRIKIGFEIALSLLRCGATVIGTTRFPSECEERFMALPDHAEWEERLHLYALDLRDLHKVTTFTEYLLQRYATTGIFAIINNAAQTIARPNSYYSGVWEKEHTRPATKFIDRQWTHVTPTLTSLAYPGENMDQQVLTTVYDRYDLRQESTDRRATNSWTERLHEVRGEEAAEVMAINALAPLILNARLKPLLLARKDPSTSEKRFIINVSAMEGQFYRHKDGTHAHTNMAKAALNMMTRTSAGDYAKDGIFMNSVDTGWITDESPYAKQQRRTKEHKLFCPIDEVDAAARCLDLIYTDSSQYGKFWKDYTTVAW